MAEQRSGFLEKMEPTVFFTSAALIVGFVLFGSFATETAAGVFDAIQGFIANTFGWVYVLGVTFMVGFVIWLYFSPYGHIRFGGDNAKPDFSYFAWFAMLFSAGMGIGLVFWSIGEPMFHYLSPPIGEGQTPEAMRQAMKFTFFHWGFHPWAVYIIFGGAIAYFHFRHKLPLAPRSMLFPIVGHKVHGGLGHAVDIMCVVGTLFGVATSLGFGAMQINSGLGAYFHLPQDTTTQIIIIISITAVATISVVSGVNKGIRLLSSFNIYLAAFMVLFIFFAGPTLFQLHLLINTLGQYLQTFVSTSFWMDMREGSNWQTSWTIFYWGWWISWSPFVGIFIARISKGRTLREFVLNVFLVPSLVTFIWLSVFGGTGLYMEQHDIADIAGVVNTDVALSLHTVLEHLPLSTLSVALGTLLVIVFFVTSSDSGSLVVDMITSGGHPHPLVSQRIFWAVSEGAVACVLLYSGGLKALQTASITTGLPIAILLLIACYGLAKAFKVDASTEGVPTKQELIAGVDGDVHSPEETDRNLHEAS